MAYLKRLPTGAREVATLCPSMWLPQPLARRDSRYWRATLYLAAGRAYLQGVGGPETPFGKKANPKDRLYSGGWIGGEGIVSVDLETAADWCQRAGVRDEELETLAAEAKRHRLAEEAEMERFVAAGGLR